ncbi:MAG: AraC family transcriptional regulator [Planctomycetota bacterium]
MTYRFQINPARADVATSNTLLNGRARSYFDPGYKTTLSIKSVVRGESLYVTRHSTYRIRPDRFAILNRGQEYTLQIRPEPQTETLALFFQPGFVETVLDGKERSSASLLDEPVAALRDIELPERLYPMDGAVGHTLGEIAAQLHDPARSPEWLEERFYALAASLATLQNRVRREIETFPGLRVATREELYRRLHFAKDLIDSCFEDPWTIDQLAERAFLSPFHFLRMFRQAFGPTPMQYLQGRRLEEARRLLESGCSVSDACTAVGFQSLPSFSLLFKRSFGCSPSRLRSQKRRTR